MNWIAVLKSDGELPLGGRAHVIIDAERWFDARAYALAKMGEDVEVTASTLGLEPDVSIEWRGSDFRETGGRALWVREREEEWVRA
jgi:hypothetical protein